MKLTGLILALAIPTRSAKADLFGGDVAVLMQILQENIQQYYQLQQMFQQGQSAQNYLHWINAGIDNSMGLLHSLPIKDDKVLGGMREFSTAMNKVQGLYGVVPQSSESELQTTHDQTVAESLHMATEFKEYSVAEEKNSDAIALQARDASPKGAARMQAETSAQMLKSLSQLIRLNTQMLKMQSEQLAITNKQSKDGVSNYQKVNQDLGSGFSNFQPDMKLEKF